MQLRRRCAVLTSAGRDVGALMIAEGLARKYVSSNTHCPGLVLRTTVPRFAGPRGCINSGMGEALLFARS
jgi:hypothetical protein